jgi:hypothetical protein
MVFDALREVGNPPFYSRSCGAWALAWSVPSYSIGTIQLRCVTSVIGLVFGERVAACRAMPAIYGVKKHFTVAV